MAIYTYCIRHGTVAEAYGTIYSADLFDVVIMLHTVIITDGFCIAMRKKFHMPILRYAICHTVVLKMNRNTGELMQNLPFGSETDVFM